MAGRQYKRASELTLQERLQTVMDLACRGYTAMRIARELDYSVAKARIDVETIQEKIQEFGDIRPYLDNVTERTREALSQIMEFETVLWKQLDWANEWVVQSDNFGAPVREFADDGKTSTLVYGPRRPQQVLGIVSKLQDVQKQRAELLGILSKSVDITVKLEQSEKIQVIILQCIQEVDPDIATRIKHKIQAARMDVESNRMELPSAIERPVPTYQEVIEGEYLGRTKQESA
jgi:hypothetical protein